MVTAVRTAPGAVRIEQERKAELRVSRRRKKRRSAVVSRTVICILGMFFLLGYIGLYAQVTLYGYRHAELTSRIRHAEMENQYLKAEIPMLTSPQRLAAVAASAGMQQSTKTDYVAAPDHIRVAKAR